MTSTPTEIEKQGEPPAVAFDRDGYLILPALIGPELVDFCWSYANTKLGSHLIQSAAKRPPDAPFSYGDPAFEGLLEFLRPRIEAASGKRLHPTYSFVRIYKHGDDLHPHTDRFACEISISLHIGAAPAKPWALHIAGVGGDFAAMLRPGDALLYRGAERRHWRERFEGGQYVQVFLHYVDADGPYAAKRFDRRLALMAPPAGRGVRAADSERASAPEAGEGGGDA